jgi:hypothetical protein
LSWPFRLTISAANEEKNVMVALEPTERARFRRFLVDRFSLGELKDLAFDLGVDHQSFPHETIREFSREMIADFERRDQLNCLVTEVLRRRPDNDLMQLLAKLPPCSPLEKMQIIVAEDLLQLPNASELVEELATKFEVSRHEVVLIGAAWRSMRLLMGLPEKAVDLRVMLEVRSLGDGKYHVISIATFDSLDSASQRAWSLVARKWSPVR